MRWLWIAVVLAALALRVALTVRYAQPMHPELWEFGVIAHNLHTTGVYAFMNPAVPSAFMPPGYPLLIAMLYGALGEGPAAHVVLGGILLAIEIAIPFLIAALACRLWGRRAARVALVLALFWPQLLLLSGRLHSLPISMALMLLALRCVWEERLGLYTRAAIVGVILAVYGMFRMEMAALLLPFIYALWTEGARAPAVRPIRTRAGACLLLVAVCLVGVSPWIIRNYLAFGRIVLGTQGGYNLLLGHHEGASGTGRAWTDAEGEEPLDMSRFVPAHEGPRTASDELDDDRYCRDQAVAYALSRPGEEVRLALSKSLFFLVADFTHPIQRRLYVWAPSLIALGIGLAWWLARGRKDSRQQTLWIVFAEALAISVVFVVLPRYRIAVDFVPILFLAGCLAFIYGRRVSPSSPASPERSLRSSS